MRKKKKLTRFEKLLLTAASLALFLGLTVGVTIAFVAVKTPTVENTFVPGHVEVSVQTQGNGAENRLTSGVIANDQSNIPVYVRVRVVINWAHPSGGVCGASHDSALPSIPLNTAGNWVLGTDGFYYYTQPVEVDGVTANLFSGNLTLPTASDGCTAQVYILASAIQAQGSNGSLLAYQDAWGASAPIGQ